MPRVRCTGGTTSWQPYVENASQRSENSPVKKGDATLHEAWKGAKTALRRGIKKSRLQCWKDLIGEVREGSMGSRLQNSHQVFGMGGSSQIGRSRGASSYRPICLLDTMGKFLEELILQRLQALLVEENGLSENQFGFSKGRSTVDAIQALCSSSLGQCLAKPCYPEEAVLGAETCRAENSFGI